MLDFLEFEETVGRLWHRLVGDAASWPRHPAHGVALDEVRGPLMVFFRGLGGAPAVQLGGSPRRTWQHRLRLRQRFSAAEERLEHPRHDGATLFMPLRIDLFAGRRLNRALYFWLAAYCAHAVPAPCPETDPLRRDIATLRRAARTVRQVLGAHRGLRAVYGEMCAALAATRPARPLPACEREVEALVRIMLTEGAVPECLPLLADDAPLPARAPAGYLPVLPVPLWADTVLPAPGPAAPGADQPAQASLLAAMPDPRKRHASRRDADQARRRDPFVLNRFEKILALAEMVNVNRPGDDDDEEEAQKAADDLDELAVTRQHRGKPATRLKFDLDLPPQAIDRAAIDAELTYPEWDYTRRTYLPGHCRVVAAEAAEDGERWTPDDTARRQIRRVRRQFEALRPRREMLRAQLDGDELDLDALVRSMSEIRAGGSGSDAIHLAHRPVRHDLAVTLLVDVSLSTDAWVDGRRVLDIEKEALLALAHGLSACGDASEILTFTSRRRSWVRLETVKRFDEPMSERIERRIAALKPGYYTRMGPAIRHATARLADRPNRRRLLLVLTDGKPNDVDHYEGRFGIEDTRRAVIEARQRGITVFGVTVDREAQSYFPALFGRGGYAILSHPARLPAALPAIYRELVR